MALGIVFFGFASAVIYSHAATNDRGLIIDGLIRFETGQASLFLWCLFGASVMMTLGAVLAVVKGMTSAQTLVMDDKSIRLPKWGLGNSVVTIPYADIVAMDLLQVSRTRLLMIRYRRGKVSVGEGMLPDAAAFDRVCHALAERVASARRVADIKG